MKSRKRRSAGVCFGSLMRLVTYDRGGHRRLGAILGGEVVDLPDAVGHPAFPTTLEALVSSSRGSVMDAARAALERDEAMEHVSKRARVLAPLFPRSLLAPGALEVDRRIVGPEEEIPWPEGAAWLDYEPLIAAILGAEATAATPEQVRGDVFGYTLVGSWTARAADGDPVETAEDLPVAIGPCIVTADDVDPQTMWVQLKLDGQEKLKGNLNGTAASLFSAISEISAGSALERGDAYALGPFSGRMDSPTLELWPDALVELGAEGIGTLRNKVAGRG
jgi:2-keto-4-pentenoate hydratase/2-oxohepta-3-ene-1,7-dioic acid hydratase in catechol pathway